MPAVVILSICWDVPLLRILWESGMSDMSVLNDKDQQLAYY